MDPLDRLLQGGGDIPDRGGRPDISQNSAGGMGFVNSAISGFADDPERQIDFLSQQTGIPIERWGVVDNQIVYVDDSGGLQAAFPDDWSVESLARNRFRESSKILPTGAGMATGILTAPMLLGGPAGIAGSVVLTGSAASAGEAARQGIGNAFLNDPVSGADIAYEGGVNAFGQLGAGVMTKIMGRGVAQDINRLNMDDAVSLQNKFEQFGIRNRPAQVTNLPSTIARDKALQRNPASSGIMMDEVQGQQDDVARSVNAFMSDLSPNEGAELVGDAAIKQAGKAMDAVAVKRAAEASPLYKQAFESSAEVDTRDVVRYINEQLKTAKGTPMKTSLIAVRELLNANQKQISKKILTSTNVQKAIREVAERATKTGHAHGEGKAVLDKSVEGLHNAKLALNAMMERNIKNPVDSVTRAKLTEVNTRLLKAIDTVSPEYAAARKVYADLSPGVEKIREGLLGQIADLKSKDAINVSMKMMNPKAGAREISLAKNSLYSLGDEGKAAWNGLKRDFLEQHFDEAGKQFQSITMAPNTGAKFAGRVMYNKKSENAMKAILEPDEFKVFSDLMEVLRATGRSRNVGSDTAANLAADSGLARGAMGLTQKSLQPRKSLFEWMNNASLGKQAGALANAMTDPNALNVLKELSSVTKGSARKYAIVAHALGIITPSPRKAMQVKSGRLPEALNKSTVKYYDPLPSDSRGRLSPLDQLLSQ